MNLYKSKKGNIYASVMIAVMIFLVGMIVVNFLKPEVTDARTNLVCTAPATDGTKVLCLVIDSVVPYFIILILSIAGGLITEKLLV